MAKKQKGKNLKIGTKNWSSRLHEEDLICLNVANIIIAWLFKVLNDSVKPIEHPT